MTDLERASEAADTIRWRVPDVPAVAVVLGSGLGAFAESLRDAVAVPYEEIPHWPPSRIAGHAGRLVAGTAGNGRRVLALSGRVHAYEGHPLTAVVFGIRVLGQLGVRTVVLTNAAGGINRQFAAGARSWRSTITST